MSSNVLDEIKKFTNGGKSISIIDNSILLTVTDKESRVFNLDGVSVYLQFKNSDGYKLVLPKYDRIDNLNCLIKDIKYNEIYLWCFGKDHLNITPEAEDARFMHNSVPGVPKAGDLVKFRRLCTGKLAGKCFNSNTVFLIPKVFELDVMSEYCNGIVEDRLYRVLSCTHKGMVLEDHGLVDENNEVVLVTDEIERFCRRTNRNILEVIADIYDTAPECYHDSKFIHVITKMWPTYKKVTLDAIREEKHSDKSTALPKDLLV